MANIKTTIIHPDNNNPDIFWNNNDPPALNATNLNQIESALETAIRAAGKIATIESKTDSIDVDLQTTLSEFISTNETLQPSDPLVINNELNLPTIRLLLSQLFAQYDQNNELTGVGIGDGTDPDGLFITKQYVDSNYEHTVLNYKPTVSVASNIASFHFEAGGANTHSDRFEVDIDTSSLTTDEQTISTIAFTFTDDNSNSTIIKLNNSDITNNTGTIPVNAFDFAAPEVVHVAFERVYAPADFKVTVSYNDAYGANFSQVQYLAPNVCDAFNVSIDMKIDQWSGGSVSQHAQQWNLASKVSVIAAVPGADVSINLLQNFDSVVFQD